MYVVSVSNNEKGSVMGECQEVDDVFQVARDTVVLAIRLVDREIGNTPRRIVQALESEELSRAIRDTLSRRRGQVFCWCVQMNYCRDP